MQADIGMSCHACTWSQSISSIAARPLAPFCLLHPECSTDCAVCVQLCRQISTQLEVAGVPTDETDPDFPPEDAVEEPTQPQARPGKVSQCVPARWQCMLGC